MQNFKINAFFGWFFFVFIRSAIFTDFHKEKMLNGLEKKPKKKSM